MKKVSVVLPVYNGEKTLKEAVNSILEQDYLNIELIIVNDCSTDGTLDIINEYLRLDERVKVINNEINMKLPRSLNVGFDCASGDYYTWTSDDNILKKNMISVLVACLEREQDIGMVYANYTNINEKGEIINEVNLGEPSMLPFSNPIGACFLYKSDVAKQVGRYDDSLFLAEDYDYWIRIYKKAAIVHIKDNLYYYRRHSESLSETRRNAVKSQTYNVLEKHFIFLCSMIKNRKTRHMFYTRMIELQEFGDTAYFEKTISLIDCIYKVFMGKRRNRI